MDSRAANPPDQPGRNTSGSPTAVVSLRGITKQFGAVTACRDVDFDLHPGRIHGLLGENGAGKSTLMKMLIGLVVPDTGTISFDGGPVSIADPQTAASLGIGMVHQHFSLVEELTVWENVAMGDRGRLDRSAARRSVVEVGERYGLEVDPDRRVGDLSAGLRQRVEIIKCLRRDPRVLIFDEPTSVLIPAESEQLFGVLRRVVADEQRTVALVSHKLDEVLHATDLVSVMRRGEMVAGLSTDETDARSLARHMVGRTVSLRSESAALGLATSATEENAEPEIVPPGVRPVVLTIDDVVVTGDDGRVELDGLSLRVHAGEIVGIAGVEGNGQKALGDLLSSLVRVERGTVEVERAEVSTRRAGALLRAGVAVIPEDRHDSGSVLDMSVAENLVLANPERFARRGVLQSDDVRANAERLIAEFDIVCSGPDAPMWSLSGGNQQKAVLARELSTDPAVLVAAQPTRGLDVGAIEYMNERLRQAADDGVGVLLISTEIEEIAALSDRVLVLYRGRIVGEMRRGHIDLDRLGLLMGGALSDAETGSSDAA